MSNDEAFAFIGYYHLFIKDFKCKVCGRICQGYLEFEEHMKEHQT